MGGFLAAVYSAFGESESPIRQRLAANQWTSLRHEARALSEPYSKELPHEQFLAEARRTDDRYTTLCQVLEPTDKEAFDKSRERVKAVCSSQISEKKIRRPASNLIPKVCLRECRRCRGR